MNKAYKLVSLFDGSGGFPLAGSMCGIIPVGASEVEPYPIAVTKSRFPGMKHLGDITKINGAEIEPVDIITFGSPCQDLSVAGKRAGLKHEDNGDDETTRSGLFMEAVRIIKEMREATNGRYPTYAVWENVPGAFSSNGGEDFRTVLEELIRIAEPSAVMPDVPKGGWAYADWYMGDGWSIAYRVLDAQYWGVPQRRRRIYLVLDLGGERAGKILFERDGLRGYFAEGRTPWQGIAEDAQRCVGTDDRAGTIAYGISSYESNAMKSANPHSGIYEAQTGRTLDLNGGNPACNQGGIVVVEQGTFQNTGKGWWNESSVGATVRTPCGGDSTLANTVAEKRDPRYIVRRLTPTECARLQGFPDTWGHPDKKESLTDEEHAFWLGVRNTHAEINGKAIKDYTREQMLVWYNKLHTDSAEYKMWGNGIALPTALYVMQGIAEELEEQNDG